jgi:DNA gyrase/topoisomerase IV subunit B
VATQAVFSLKGKPLNTYGLTKKVVYENEEFNLLQSALDIEDGLDGLRYNRVVIATDADVDGMHIRLLMITFFCSFSLSWLNPVIYLFLQLRFSGFAIKRKPFTAIPTVKEKWHWKDWEESQK